MCAVCPDWAVGVSRFTGGVVRRLGKALDISPWIAGASKDVRGDSGPGACAYTGPFLCGREEVHGSKMR